RARGSALGKALQRHRPRNRHLVCYSGYHRKRAEDSGQNRPCRGGKITHDLIGAICDGAFEPAQHLVARMSENGFVPRFCMFVKLVESEREQRQGARRSGGVLRQYCVQSKSLLWVHLEAQSRRLRGLSNHFGEFGWSSSRKVDPS